MGLARGRRKVILVAVDGLGPTLLRDKAGLAGFERLAQEGTAADYLLPAFPTMPLTNAVALVSGQSPYTVPYPIMLDTGKGGIRFRVSEGE